MRFLSPALCRAFSAAAVVVAVPCLVPPPATAVSAPLSYDCTVTDVPSLGVQVFTVVLDTDVPDAIPAGQSYLWNVTGRVTLPAEVVAYLRSTDATRVDGSASVDTTLNGNFLGSPLTIAQKALPAGGPVEISGTGLGGTLPASPAGTVHQIGVSRNLNFQLKGYRSNGSVASTTAITCTKPIGIVPVDTITVVAGLTATVTAVTVQAASIPFGDRPQAIAEVAGTGNTKPPGRVAFSFDGQTVTADVTGGKATAVLPAALTMGSREVKAVFTPSDPNFASSSAVSALTVVRDLTTTTAKLRLPGPPGAARRKGQGCCTARYDRLRLGEVCPEAERSDFAYHQG